MSAVSADVKSFITRCACVRHEGRWKLSITSDAGTEFIDFDREGADRVLDALHVGVQDDEFAKEGDSDPIGSTDSFGDTRSGVRAFVDESLKLVGKAHRMLPGLGVKQ